ncbi:MAG: hypothetical protein M1817_004616 [Caeruleum heppii]|nr:MAG: hypothetical protein M1817_004616 [Caeruleum heppii]
MAFTDDAVLAKLSALNETQESIVTVAQWVLFHKRHSERTAHLWFQRLKDSGTNKRLNLIYLANGRSTFEVPGCPIFKLIALIPPEVVQQSKARRKDDFLLAFSPVIAEATSTAYRGATTEVQQKLRRVVEVFRQRQIFELPIQEAIEARINDLDKNRGSKKPLLGGSLLSGTSAPVPAEIQPLVAFQSSVSKLASGKVMAVENANQDYAKLTDPAATVLTPPTHAARLSGLLKSLATAEGAVAESIKARKSLIEGLEKVLDSNRASLQTDESTLMDLAERKTKIEAKKRDVEDSIMRGLDGENAEGNGSPEGQLRYDEGSAEPERPAVEALTPPSVEALTPTETLVPEPAPLPGVSATPNADTVDGSPSSLQEVPIPVTAGSDLLSSLSLPQARHTPVGGSGSPVNGLGGPRAKKRKFKTEDEFAALGGGDVMEDLDSDVAEMLRRGSGGF